MLTMTGRSDEEMAERLERVESHIEGNPEGESETLSVAILMMIVSTVVQHFTPAARQDKGCALYRTRASVLSCTSALSQQATASQYFMVKHNRYSGDESL